ncbi:hypothetical protein LY76DRAFT_608805 [Colletotrichum caudatum]|nr:hypothetical protein LY76DRAFT_608805 [Colletotrichum caudatum]
MLCPLLFGRVTYDRVAPSTTSSWVYQPLGFPFPTTVAWKRLVKSAPTGTRLPPGKPWALPSTVFLPGSRSTVIDPEHLEAAANSVTYLSHEPVESGERFEAWRCTGSGLATGIKINSVGFQSSGFTVEEAAELSQLLEEHSFDFVELSGGMHDQMAWHHRRGGSTKAREAFLPRVRRKCRVAPSGAVSYRGLTSRTLALDLRSRAGAQTREMRRNEEQLDHSHQKSEDGRSVEGCGGVGCSS